MQPSNVTDLLFNQLQYRAERQKVISANIANLDTPNYKTKELTFKNELNKSQADLQLRTTHTNHIQVKPTHVENKHFKIDEVQGLEEQNDGNNVNLDTQMSQQAQNNVMFNALQNSIKKDSLWFKSIISSSEKN
jgi:flagellar basal-body rod protein FlgB